MGARHASSAKGISSTYVLRPINICSTSHQHIFYASSTYVLLSSTYLLRLINVSSTSHQRYIYEGSTSHLRGILKRNESICSVWVLTRYFSPPSHALSKYMASPNSLLGLAISLRSTCHLLAWVEMSAHCHFMIIILWQSANLWFKKYYQT